MTAVRGQGATGPGRGTTARGSRSGPVVPPGAGLGTCWGTVTALLGLHLLVLATRHALPPPLGRAAAVTGAVVLLAASPQLSRTVRRHLGRVEVTALTAAGAVASAAVVVTVLLSGTTGLPGHHPAGTGWPGRVAAVLAGAALLVLAVGVGLDQRHLARPER